MTLTLLLSSCQQFAKKFQTRDGSTVILHSWVLGTKYFDKKKNKTYPGKTKVYILGEDKIRMDVFDPFGFVTVGTLIINGENMSLSTMNGADYKGPIKGEKVKELLKVDVNPKDLYSVFTQSGFSDKHWNCAVDESGKVFEECRSELHKMKINWTGRMTQKGTEVFLDHERMQLKFKVKSYKPYKSDGGSLFSL